MPAFDPISFDTAYDEAVPSSSGFGFGVFGDPFDSLMNMVCSVLTNQTSLADPYNQKLSRPQDFSSLADNVPCRISDKALGRPHELKVEKRLSENFKTVFMRPPALSDGSRLNPHHYLLVTGSIDPFTGSISPFASGDEIYFNVFEVMNPSHLNHHLECIVEQIIP